MIAPNAVRCNRLRCRRLGRYHSAGEHEHSGRSASDRLCQRARASSARSPAGSFSSADSVVDSMRRSCHGVDRRAIRPDVGLDDRRKACPVVPRSFPDSAASRHSAGTRPSPFGPRSRPRTRRRDSQRCRRLFMTGLWRTSPDAATSCGEPPGGASGWSDRFVCECCGTVGPAWRLPHLRGASIQSPASPNARRTTTPRLTTAQRIASPREVTRSYRAVPSHHRVPPAHPPRFCHARPRPRWR